MSGKTFVVAVPFVSGAGGSQREQYDAISRKIGGEVPTGFFGVPADLKIGTLDSLMECSDELFKVDAQIEAVTFKFIHFLEDINEHEQSISDLAEVVLTNSTVRCDEYLHKFTWNESSYPKKTDLKKLIDGIRDGVLRAEDVCRTKLSEYSDLKTRMTTAEKQASGTLAVKPITDLVTAWCKSNKQDGPVETDHLTTVFIVLPTERSKEFQKEYETYGKVQWEDKRGKQTEICVAVPASAVVIEGTKDYTLYAVVCLKKFADNFRNACREKRFVVREYDPANTLNSGAVQQLQREKEQKKDVLIRWLRSTFSNSYQSWVHLKAVRIFVESILRYGLPPNFVALSFNVPSAKAEKALRSKIAAAFPNLGRAIGSDDAAGGDSNALEQEFPYVSLKINHPAHRS